MIVQCGSHSDSNNHYNSSNLSNHNKDAIYNVTKAAAAKSILT
jgi:hypothetical protein